MSLPKTPSLRVEPGPRPDGGLTLHGTAVGIKDRGVLITGKPGTGKSTLAAEMIALGAELVADDWVTIDRTPSLGLVMSPPAPIAGLIELHGIGLVRLPHIGQSPLTFIADLDFPPQERLPRVLRRDLLGTACPVILCQGKRGLAASLMAVLRAGGLLEPDFFAR